MESVSFFENIHAGIVIQIIDSEEEAHEIDLRAISSWSELLGISDPVEVIEAIRHVTKSHTEPECDPETGQNVWTDAYTLLQHREQTREREAMREVEPATDFRSLELRTALAAHNVVHQPIDGGECAMDRCRRSAREALGVEEPTAKPTAMSRMSTTSVPAHAGEGDAEAYAQVLSQVAPIIDAQRRGFLHDLAGGTENPLRDTPEPEPPPDPDEPDDPFTATLKKYGGAS